MGNTKRAILCPNCGKLISADAEECIHCGMKNPGRFGFHTLVQKLFRGQVELITIVIYLCIILYVISLLLDLGSIFQSSGFLNFLPPSSRSLWRLGMTGAYAIHYGRWWTLITAIYLHGGLLHILFNMLWIRQLGPTVEELFGTARFILIFTLSGVLGFVLSNMVGGSPTIGASGSIFGLLGALIFYGRSRGGRFGEVVYSQLLVWAVVMFLFGFIYPGVNNLAHLGGFIGGYLSANLLGYQEQKYETLWQRTAAGLMIFLTILAFMLVFVFPLPL